MEPRKFYIATSLENHAAHNRVRDALQARGFRLTYDWTPHGAAWPKGAAYVREVMRAEKQGVLAADFLVLLLPGGKGTHVELGLALAIDLPILLVAEDGDLSFLRSEGPFCGFWLSDGVSHYHSVEEMLEYCPLLLGHQTPKVSDET